MRVPFSRAAAAVAGAVSLGAGAMALPASATTFSYTGAEQTYTVPDGVSSVRINAIGGAGGGPSACCLQGGRGAGVSASLPVTPGQVLYVLVGTPGSQPAGGFNGGGDGATRSGLSHYGGGGASDVRTLSISNGTASLESRLLVAAGGGGSSAPAASGGDAGSAGFPNGDPSVAGGAGTQTAGGAGGSCAGGSAGCGEPGVLGTGGAGGASGTGADTRGAGGGGGGLYGGGGGGATLSGTGGGGGGSSLVPPGGTLGLADRSNQPSVEITRDTPASPPTEPGCAGVLSSFAAQNGTRDEFSPEASGRPLAKVAREHGDIVRCFEAFLEQFPR